MMVAFKRPYYGAISDKLIRGVREINGKYYALDNAYNKYEIEECEYQRLLNGGFKKV